MFAVLRSAAVKRLPHRILQVIQTKTKPHDDSQQTTPVSASRKKSAHGLELLSNGVVSMRSLELNQAVPTKTRDPDAQKLYEGNLTVSKAHTFFLLVVFGKHQKTEKHRDEAASWKIFYSAAPYCLSEEKNW